MKLIAAVIAFIAILYVLALSYLFIRQRTFLYQPSQESVAPAGAGLPQADVLSLRTRDGETLVAWYVPAKAGKPLFLYFHGNSGGLADRAKRFSLMTAEGEGLLAIAYRSFAGSTGSPSEAGLTIDAERAYEEALKLGYTPERIVAVGESLGTGVAIELATRKPLAALVLDSPYTSTTELAAARYWMFPVPILMKDQFHSDLLIGKIHVPILMVHGADDSIIPLANAKALFALANEPKTFIEVPQAEHLVLGRPDVLPRVLQWVDAAVPAAKP